MVIAGEWRWDIYEEALAAGFRANGVEVIPFKAGNYLGSDLLSRIERKTLWGPATVRLNKALQRIISESSPDVLFLWRMTHIFRRTLATLLRKYPGLRVVTYNNDSPFQDGRGWKQWRHYIQTARLAHLNFVYRPSDVSLAQEAGIPNPRVLLPYYLKEVHRPITEIPPDFQNDVVFVGHYEDDGRVETLNYLARKGVSVRIYGTLWENASLEPELKRMPIHPAYGEDYVRALAGAKIALVFLSGKNRDVYTRRCFEIPACGTAMVAPRTPELGALYRDGVEAAYFNSKEELLIEIQRLLEDDRKRDQIAKAGLARCLGDGHSNIDRGEQVIRALKEDIF
ncbi:MAG: Spore maturation protein CgeB [Chloroflexi bacterium]|jgi:hypothetical protein|nr:MAG: Spore maturation protein CgeB [Chloroflexota bacterium]